MTRALLAAASAVALLALGACGDSGGSSGGARAGIWAAGSSTVFPFATRVAENFQRTTNGAAPRVESLGTGGGIQAFCQGVGPTTPDIANASRPMKASEFELCRTNGVTDIVEIKIGFDGIVIATARTGASFDLRLQDLYLGLAKEVPGANGAFVANPAAMWNQVNPALPAQRIQVYGPPPTSGTRDAFLELGMAPAAKLVPALAAIEDEDRFETLAHTLREDNAWIDSG
ncbi:MAG TPA: substrate-binding domain-containing protein, partial [Brevundimonas sp.]|nr:substrate-binding domain-containing protein [Brevundimonas sp.]